MWYMTLREPSRLFDRDLWRFIRARLRVHQDLEFRESKTEWISTFDRRSWELSAHPQPHSAVKTTLKERRAAVLSACTAAGSSALSTVNFKFIKKRWAKSSAISSFIETKQLNKFQFSSTFWRARIAIFIFRNSFPPSWIVDSIEFPVKLVSIWKTHKSGEAVDCKEADPQPRSISPVLKGTWEGLYKLCFYNWDL